MAVTRGFRAIIGILLGLVITSQVAFFVVSSNPTPAHAAPATLFNDLFPDGDPDGTQIDSGVFSLPTINSTGYELYTWYDKISSNTMTDSDKHGLVDSGGLLSGSIQDKIAAQLKLDSPGQFLNLTDICHSVGGLGNPNDLILDSNLCVLTDTLLVEYQDAVLAYSKLTHPDPFTQNADGTVTITNPDYFELNTDGKPALKKNPRTGGTIGSHGAFTGNIDYLNVDVCPDSGKDLYNCYKSYVKKAEVLASILQKIWVVQGYPQRSDGNVAGNQLHGIGDSNYRWFNKVQMGDKDSTSVADITPGGVLYPTSGGTFDSIVQIFSDPVIREVFKPPTNGAWAKVEQAAANTHGLNDPAGTDPCSTKSPGTDIGLGIQIALCNIVDFIHSGVNEFLAGSAFFLANVSGMTTPNKNAPNGGVKVVNGASKSNAAGGSSALGNLFLSVVPKELQGNNIIALLNTPLVVNVSSVMRTLLGMLVILMLLLVAFANILQINVNTYGIKKIVPGIIIGYIIAYFGVFAVKAGVEVSNSITQVFLGNALGTQVTQTTQECYGSGLSVQYLVMGLSNVEARKDCNVSNNFLRDPDKNVPNMGLVIKQGVLNILIFAAGVMLFILAFLFLLRGVIFIGLAAISPVGLFAAFVPPLSSIWQKWSKTFSGWIFMNVVALFWLWLATQFLMAGAKTGSALAGVATGLIGYAFGMFCVYMAMKTPFSMAGEATQLLNKWNAMGKNAWGRTGGAFLKSSGKNIGAWSGLLPGVASTKKWYADAVHNAERRNKMWAQGLTQRGADQILDTQKKNRDRDRELKEKEAEYLKEYDDRMKPLVEAHRKELSKIENDTNLTDDQKDAATEAEKARHKAAVDRQKLATGLADKEKELGSDIEKLRQDVLTNAGVGRAGRKFLKLSQADATYAARHKEHDSHVEVATEAALRELRAAHTEAAQRYQHLNDDAKDAALYANEAKSLGQYYETAAFNAGGHGWEQQADGTWVMHYDKTLANGRRNAKSMGATLTRINQADEEIAGLLGALENYTNGKPMQLAGQSAESFKLELSKWNNDETISKRISRDIADKQKNNPSFGAAKYNEHGKDIMNQVTWKEMLERNKDTAQTLDMQFDLLGDRYKAAGNMAGAYNLFGNQGSSPDNVPVKARDVFDAASMLLRFGGEGIDPVEKGILIAIRDKAKDMRDNGHTWKKDLLEERTRDLKAQMLNAWNSKEADGFKMMFESELLNRDPYRANYFF